MNVGSPQREPLQFPIRRDESPAVPLEEQSRRSDRGPLVSIDEGVIPDDAVEKGSRLPADSWMWVFAAEGREGTRDGGLEQSKVANPVAPPGLVDQTAVAKEDLLDGESVQVSERAFSEPGDTAR